jgi:hypothetical protein
VKAPDAAYTRKLFDDAISLEQPDRVPILANVFSWPVVMSRYPLSVAMRDYDKLFEIYYHFARDYCHDSLHDVGWRNPLRCHDAIAAEGGARETNLALPHRPPTMGCGSVL